jgi:hypothetical protein
VITGFVAASALFIVAFGLAFVSGRVLATHAGSGSVHACVNLYTGQTRIMLPGRPPACTTSETLVEWPSSASTTDLMALEARVLALEEQVPDCLSESGTTALFSGCDIQIVNGMGSTPSANGTGNLIVGYNEDISGFPRGGSHNIVVGSDHGYGSYGGLSTNALGDYSSVNGGSGNVASGLSATVGGGLLQTADMAFQFLP